MKIEDRTAKFIIWFSRFKVMENKDFNIKCDKDLESRSIYIFNNKEELINYLIENGVDDAYYLNRCLDKCIFMITKKGTILAYKAICDIMIEKYNTFSKTNINESNKGKELSK